MEVVGVRLAIGLGSDDDGLARCGGRSGWCWGACRVRSLPGGADGRRGCGDGGFGDGGFCGG